MMKRLAREGGTFFYAPMFAVMTFDTVFPLQRYGDFPIYPNFPVLFNFFSFKYLETLKNC